MPRGRTSYICQSCGSQYPQSYGRCPSCGGWDTIQETFVRQGSAAKSAADPHGATDGRVQFLADISTSALERIHTPLSEFDRVLGGGIVPGSAVLLGGDPGIGKSTILLQISRLIADEDVGVLYASGEESAEQIKLRAERLTRNGGNLAVLPTTDATEVCDTALALECKVLVVDSIQTMQLDELESPAGSVSQTRECTSRFVRMAKESGMAVFLVGHVTKDGAIAGPKVLEHMVDVVLYLEGDNYQAHRLLRCIKNRYGATHEIGVFDMRDSGLWEVTNPSALFLTENDHRYSGSAIAVTLEGTRPLLVEIQALATPTSFGLPRRSCTGLDVNRLHMLTAVLGKRARLDVSTQDIYVNAVGGLRIDEPAVDLAILSAIYSSYADRELPRLATIGEVGLGGEVRPVRDLERRVREAEKLGLERAIVPRASSLNADFDIQVDAISSVQEALHVLATC